jgi:hypothetical protein
MRPLSELSLPELDEARHATETLMSGKLRRYIPGRMLPVLLSKFNDDLRDMLGMELCPRPPAIQQYKLDMLTDVELDTVNGSVSILLDRFADFMDDPALPKFLGDLRALLATERQERIKVREAFGREHQADAS